MIVSLVAAMAHNRTIGKDNKLIWHLPEDLEFFKSTTKNKVMIMGRKTYESLPKALPNRFHIVISRKSSASQNDRVLFVTSIDEAIRKSEELIKQGWPDEVCVIGGAEIYKLFVPYADRIYLTEISKSFDGDTYFPEFDKSQFRPELLKKSKDGDVFMDFMLYHRKSN